MSNGMKFDAAYQRSKGNFLNVHEDLIDSLIRDSDGRSKERYDYQKSLRKKFLPEIPGYSPKNPVFKAEAERTLDYLIELRVKAARINKDTPLTAQLAPLKEILKAAFDPKTTISQPISTSLNILRAYTDGIGEGERARARMMREFYNQSYSFTVLSNRMYMEEKKDSSSWRESERYRADVSRNRLESFFLGQAMAGLHHETSQAIATMEKTWRGEEERYQGSKVRRAAGVLGDVGSLSLPAYLIYNSEGMEPTRKKVEGLYESVKNGGKGVLNSVMSYFSE